MGGGEVKPGKSQKGSAQRHLNAGFVAGGLLMLLVYLVAQHFVVSAPHGNEPFDPHLHHGYGSLYMLLVVWLSLVFSPAES